MSGSFSQFSRSVVTAVSSSIIPREDIKESSEGGIMEKEKES